LGVKTPRNNFNMQACRVLLSNFWHCPAMLKWSGSVSFLYVLMEGYTLRMETKGVDLVLLEFHAQLGVKIGTWMDSLVVCFSGNDILQPPYQSSHIIPEALRARPSATASPTAH
jgi:hypothetical protein